MRILPFFFLFALQYFCFGQDYDLILKGGHVVDPKNQIDGPMDVAIKDKKIAAISSTINIDQAKKVIDVTGLYVVPGLIDMHVHVSMAIRLGHTLRMVLLVCHLMDSLLEMA